MTFLPALSALVPIDASLGTAVAVGVGPTRRAALGMGVSRPPPPLTKGPLEAGGVGIGGFRELLLP